jgi:hypothetical protein
VEIATREKRSKTTRKIPFPSIGKTKTRKERKKETYKIVITVY